MDVFENSEVNDKPSMSWEDFEKMLKETQAESLKLSRKYPFAYLDMASLSLKDRIELKMKMFHVSENKSLLHKSLKLILSNNLGLSSNCFVDEIAIKSISNQNYWKELSLSDIIFDLELFEHNVLFGEKTDSGINTSGLTTIRKCEECNGKGYWVKLNKFDEFVGEYGCLKCHGTGLNKEDYELFDSQLNYLHAEQRRLDIQRLLKLKENNSYCYFDIKRIDKRSRVRVKKEILTSDLEKMFDLLFLLVDLKIKECKGRYLNSVDFKRLKENMLEEKYWHESSVEDLYFDMASFKIELQEIDLGGF